MTTTDDAAAVVEMGRGMNEQVQQYLDQMKARSDESISLLEDTYSSVISRMELSIFVDAVNGDDSTGNGSDLLPYKTIKKAVLMSPFGSFLTLFLKTDIHIVDQVLVSGISLLLKSDSSVERKITFERKKQVFNNINYRFLEAFVFGNGGSIIFNKIWLDYPVLDEQFTATSPTLYANIFSYSNFSEMAAVFLKLSNCTMNIPSNNFGSLLSFSSLSYSQQAIVLPDQNYKGRIISSITDTTGTAVSSVPSLVSNLTDI